MCFETMSRVQISLNDIGNESDAQPSNPKEQYFVPRLDLESVLLKHKFADFLVRLSFRDPITLMFTLQVRFHPILKGLSVVLRKFTPKK